MKLRRNLYMVLGMAAWRYGMPYARKRLQDRENGQRQATASS